MQYFITLIIEHPVEGFCAMHMRTNKDTIWVQGLGKVLSGKQHPNLQDLGKLLLLGGGLFRYRIQAKCSDGLIQ